MSQIIMLFLFPISLYFYFFKERPARPQYFKTFTDFEVKVQQDSSLEDAQKIQHFKEMLIKNDYVIQKVTETTVIGEKRLFSMSLLAMGIGLYFIGVIIYLLYFYYIQKPHRVVFCVSAQNKKIP